VSDDPRAGLQRIRSGLTRVAIPTGAPVVPVGIWGTHHLWPKEGLDRAGLLRRPTIAIVIGQVLEAHPDETPGEFRERYRVALDAVVSRARTMTGDPA
jgi:1-acyl-sn-glycerol-3-phosphate acyltransferase